MTYDKRQLAAFRRNTEQRCEEACDFQRLGAREADHHGLCHRNKGHMKMTHLQLRAGANHVVVAFRAHDSGQIATGKLQAHSLQFLCMVLLCQS